MGSEALDEVVGGLKIQLAPKTNFWSNTAGAENVANAVIDLLAPTSKTVVLEIGCGIGLIGLMMASVSKKCIRKAYPRVRFQDCWISFYIIPEMPTSDWSGFSIRSRGS